MLIRKGLTCFLKGYSEQESKHTIMASIFFFKKKVLLFLGLIK